VGREECAALIGRGREQVTMPTPSSELYGIYDGERLTSIGSLWIRSRKAILSTDFTLPEFRGQGRHAVLVRWRIEQARARGAVKVEAVALKTSVRRYLAEGFYVTKLYQHGWKVQLDL
jgi:GNAT superfamily N-acetyltransferase